MNKVSIIIPTYNAASFLDELLASLMIQTAPPQEILVIDSSSTDETLQIASAPGIKTKKIEKSEFDHAGTRTLAAEIASGDYLIFLTQDALPADENSICNIIEPLTHDERIAAVGGKQIPDEKANLLARHSRFYNYSDQPFSRSMNDAGKYGFRTFFLSNSFAAYRKDCLKEIGYFGNNVDFGEDAIAAAKLLLHGYCIGYAPSAKVIHSHNYTMRQELSRYFKIGTFHARNRRLFKRFGPSLSEGLKFIRSESKFILQNRSVMLFLFYPLRIVLRAVAYYLGKAQAFRSN